MEVAEDLGESNLSKVGNEVSGPRPMGKEYFGTRHASKEIINNNVTNLINEVNNTLTE